MLTRIKKAALGNQSVSITSETTNRMIFTETKILVHFYKQIPGHHHHFPWLSTTLAVFHDFPGPENGLTKFHDFPGIVVTLVNRVQVISARSCQTMEIGTCHVICLFTPQLSWYSFCWHMEAELTSVTGYTSRSFASLQKCCMRQSVDPSWQFQGNSASY